MFGSDLLIRFPAKNEISDDRSLLQQEQHCDNDKRPEMRAKKFQQAEEIGSRNAIKSSTNQASVDRRFGCANKLSVEINGQRTDFWTTLYFRMVVSLGNILFSWKRPHYSRTVMDLLCHHDSPEFSNGWFRENWVMSRKLGDFEATPNFETIG
jgi:hypothetical protein